MEEAQSTCQKVELSGNIRVLLRELPLTCEKRRTDDVCREFLNHHAAHTMMISDIATNAWLIDFCHKAIKP